MEKDFENSRSQPPVKSQQEGKHCYVDLKRRPISLSKTGGWSSAPFTLCVSFSSAACYVFVYTLTSYLISHMHQSPAKAAVILANFGGTFYLLTVLGGFIADSYLGAYTTIVIGMVFQCLGLGLMVISSSYSKLQPPPCMQTKGMPCPPAGARYMAPLYAALYTACIGEGLVKPNIISMGAVQFDKSIPRERELGAQYFRYTFLFVHSGLFVAGFPLVYLIVVVTPGWGFGAMLMLYALCGVFFLLGTPKYRHLPPSRSFLTRMAQVFTAATLKPWPLKRRFGIADLHDPKIPPGFMFERLQHTDTLRYLDRAAIIATEEDKEIALRGTSSWRLCSVTQVEETKRILQVLPIWATSAFAALIFAQLSSFTVQAAATLDRNFGPHFTLPAASVGGSVVIFSLISVQLYHKVLVPFVRRFNHNPYGFRPLPRAGVGIFSGTLMMVVAALVERKRLSVVRELHLEDMELGSFVLPMKVWWLLPQMFLASCFEFNLGLASYEFYFREVSTETSNFGSSFFWSILAMGFFFSSVLINLVNTITGHQRTDGGWLEGQ